MLPLICTMKLYRKYSNQSLTGTLSSTVNTAQADTGTLTSPVIASHFIQMHTESKSKCFTPGSAKCQANPHLSDYFTRGPQTIIMHGHRGSPSHPDGGPRESKAAHRNTDGVKRQPIDIFKSRLTRAASASTEVWGTCVVAMVRWRSQREEWVKLNRMRAAN
jgi:hypothetical protein